MDRYEIYDIWAPAESIWSTWVKPAVFTDPSLTVSSGEALPDKTFALSGPYSRDFALILDLPGLDAIVCGLQLARQGFRPLPLFNALSGSYPLQSALDMAPIIAALGQGAKILQGISLPPEAPPAFLLDYNRMQGAAGPGQFDNRWVALPQDFPSGNRLLAHGIRRVAVIQSGSSFLKADLALVLRPWQQAGLDIWLDRIPTPQMVGGEMRENRRLEQIGSFSLWRMALAAVLMTSLRLRRNPAGAFGVTIPEASESSGYGGGFRGG